jgi:hypothetical protein
MPGERFVRATERRTGETAGQLSGENQVDWCRVWYTIIVDTRINHQLIKRSRKESDPNGHAADNHYLRWLLSGSPDSMAETQAASAESPVCAVRAYRKDLASGEAPLTVLSG